MFNIAARLRPFSHQPGARCLIPGTATIVEAYPALIRLHTLEGELIEERALEIEGPLEQFTVVQDLERGCVTLFSERYRFHILPDHTIVQTKQPHLAPLHCKERLSLGSHKKQEWEGIKRRCDFREIFPLWLRLGSLLEPKNCNSPLLDACQKAIRAHKPEHILPAFRNLFLAGFSGMLVPRAEDTDFQGILPADTPVFNGEPLALLTEGARLICSLFYTAKGSEQTILPNLPPEFSAGRLCGLAGGTLDLEWSKKRLRRMHFRAAKSGETLFHFQPALRHFRLRTSLKAKGEKITRGRPLQFEGGKEYFFDQFEQ